MAIPSVELVMGLRKAAALLKDQSPYQWGHMGQCNCGHLVQVLTKRTAADIHRSAMEREGDWVQQVRDYCPTSGLLIDDVITDLLASGLERRDIGYLERLSDPVVLAGLPEGRQQLTRNKRDDVVAYLLAWAALLQSGLETAAVPPATPSSSDKQGAQTALRKAA